MQIDGVFVDVASDLTYQVNSFTREGLVGQSGVQGFKVTPCWGEMTATLRDTDAFNPQLVSLMTGVTVTAQLANGRVVVATDAFAEDVQKINTAESTYEVKFRSSNVVVF